MIPSLEREVKDLYEVFADILSRHDENWIAKNIVLQTIKYHSPPIEIVGFFTFNSAVAPPLSEQFFNLYKALPDDFEIKVKFKEAIYLALENWFYDTPSDVPYLMQLCWLLSYLREPRFVDYFRMMMLDGHVLSRLDEADYIAVVKLGMGITVTFAANPEVQAFISEKFFDINPTYERKYAPFGARLFIALCRVAPNEYAPYLARFVTLYKKYPHNTPRLDVELERFVKAVPARVFLAHFSVAKTSFASLHATNPNEVKAVLSGYFHALSSVKEAGMYPQAKVFVDFLCEIDGRLSRQYKRWLASLPNDASPSGSMYRYSAKDIQIRKPGASYHCAMVIEIVDDSQQNNPKTIHLIQPKRQQVRFNIRMRRALQRQLSPRAVMPARRKS